MVKIKHRDGNESLYFLVMAVFFGVGLLLSREFISVSSAWDYVVIQVLTMMNGLGLGIVLLLWISRLGNGKGTVRKGNETADE